MYIPLDYWWIGIVSYLFCHAAHIVWWRFAAVNRGVVALLLIFFVPVIAIGLAGLAHTEISMIPPLFTHACLAAQYVAVYPAVQACSPTLKILEYLRLSVSTSEDQLVTACAPDSIVQARLDDLEKGGLVGRMNEKYSLNTTGHFVAYVFQHYRRLLRLPLGAG